MFIKISVTFKETEKNVNGTNGVLKGLSLVVYFSHLYFSFKVYDRTAFVVSQNQNSPF